MRVLCTWQEMEALRTRNFLLIDRDAVRRFQNRDSSCHADADESFTQLFLKPEDAWELNNIAGQNPEQITLMRDRMGVEGSIRFRDSL